jgi:protein-disulfide isomerase
MRSQRGRTTPTRRKNTNGLLYGVLAVIVIAGIALVGVLSLGGGGASTTAQPGTITSSVALDSLPSRGQASAPVTVVEYADFQCPACQYFATQLEPAFAQQYIDTGKVRMVFHDFPLSQHQNAVIAAEAARAAGEQGKFWEMHDLLYAKQDEWASSAQPQTLFAGYAAQLKLDANQFSQALDSHKYRAEVQSLAQDATRGGVSSTPTFVIDGKPYSYAQLQQAVDAALAAKK